MTEESSFGSGIKLNQGFDMEVTSSGDIKTVLGLDELEKDLSFFVADFLNDSHGGPITSDTEQTLKSGIREILLDDPRIIRIVSLSVSAVNGSNLVRIRSKVVADDESEQDLIFTV